MEEKRNIELKVGNIVFYDPHLNKMVTEPASGERTDSNIPIGIVVIPRSHTEDGKARMVSLKYMSCHNPENGSVLPNDMVFGRNDTEFGLFSVWLLPRLKNTQEQVLKNGRSLGFFAKNLTINPSARKTYPNPNDEGTFYVSDRYALPSPYAKDGGINELYRVDKYPDGRKIKNALYALDGKKCTEEILSLRGDNEKEIGFPLPSVFSHFPAASCCNLYYTPGTKRGDWYLPSLGELGYFFARCKEINEALGMLSHLNMMELSSGVGFWASNMVNDSYVWKVDFDDCFVHQTSTTDKACAVAFAKVDI